MLTKRKILTLTALFCLFFLLFQTVGCNPRKYLSYTPETIQGENESEIPLPQNNSVSDSCADVTGLAFSSVSYLANPQYPNGYSVCQDECIDLDTNEGTWNAYDIYTGDEWCSDLNSNTENPTYIYCCAYCPQETHYCPISKSCVSDPSTEQGLQWKLECPYITLSWDKDKKAVSYEIIPFYDENKDGIEDGKCEEDISNTKERYFYYNLESSDCAGYYTGNIRFQIIPQYSDSLSIDSYNTEWIDVSSCKFGPNMKSCSDNNIDSSIIPHNTCSASKPYLCYDGTFIKDCSKCGCPTSWKCWENVPTGSICNPHWLYNYNDFEIPSDDGFLELMENPYYTPHKLTVWMNINFEYKSHFIGAYSPYEIYIKKKGDCRDMATFATYIEHHQGYDSYRLVLIWGAYYSHMVSVYKELGGYSYISNNDYYQSGFSSFKEVAERVAELYEDKGTPKFYIVWNYDGFLVEKPVYKGKYYEYEDFSDYEWT